MSYYGQGDYYQGDYYRGDPFLGGLIGALAKPVVRLAGKGVAAVAGAFKSPARTALGTAVAKASPAIVKATPYIAPISTGVALAGMAPKLLGAGGGKAPPQMGGQREWDIGSALPGGMPLTYITGGACPKGYRLNKSGYWLMNGSYIPPQSRCVRYRSMNVTNVRSLRRGIRRAAGFAKIARRVLTFVQAKAPKGRPRFKRRK